MGNIASINFKPTNAIQLEHNDRTRKPTYLLVNKGIEDIECTLNAKEALALREQLIAQAKENYRRAFNQPFKATDYLRSAVVNIKETTTMADLQKLAIHRDEGHIDERTGETILNHHAYMEFVTLHPETGKSQMRKISKDGVSFKSDREAFENIQTEVAQILGMERGRYKNNKYDKEGNLIRKGAYQKRIEPRVYAKIMQKDARPLRAEIAQLKETQEQEHQTLNDICNEIAPQSQPLNPKEALQFIKDKVQEWVGINKALGNSKLYTKEDYTALWALKHEGSSIEELKNKIAKLEQQAQDRQQQNQELEQQTQELKEKVKSQQDLLDRQAPKSNTHQFLQAYSREKLISTCIAYDNQRMRQQAEWLRNQEIINMLIARPVSNRTDRLSKKS
ncbi:hypothetical protein [Helicobacter labacensis]|uniref:hypothetical protein n=1 Tax=Helicobacter labacensis TaxID=2316079 RepID=UPI0019693D17|nr:hypothetical protein [Helicobacter labacensis]